MPDITQLAAQLRAAIAEATPGPWRREFVHVWSASKKANIASACELYTSAFIGYTAPGHASPDLEEIGANAEYIALANPANLTALLDALDALRVDAERYRWLRERPTYLGWDADYRADEVDAEIDTARGGQEGGA